MAADIDIRSAASKAEHFLVDSGNGIQGPACLGRHHHLRRQELGQRPTQRPVALREVFEQIPLAASQ